MSNGRKIANNQENPIDNHIIEFSEHVSDPLIKIGFTPNMITTIGTIFGILTLYCIYIDKFIPAFIFFWLSYFMDCLDGFYARKYKLYSKFGDYYDHIRDIIIFIFFTSLVFYKLKTKKEKIFFITVLIFTGFLAGVHMGCQEKNSSDTKHNDTINNLSKLCYDKSHIKYSRYLGMGTLNFVLSYFILYLNSQN